MTRNVAIGTGPAQAQFGADLPLGLIAGPCQIESRDHSLRIAETLADIARRRGMGLVFKASFDKANRTSLHAPRGVGLQEGLRILEDVRAQTGLPVLSDVHDVSQCAPVAAVVDALQIPAFLCRQTDLLVAAAQTGKPVNVKKGQFLAPWDMAAVVGKLSGAGCDALMLTERGSSFGYNTLINDMRALPQLAQNGWPVIFDATHSAQHPGGLGTASGGQREYVPVLARAAVAVGVAGVFIETHPDPDTAPSDGPNMWPLAAFESLIVQLQRLDAMIKGAV